MNFELTMDEQIILKNRIEGLKNLERGEVYLKEISKMIKPDLYGRKNLMDLTENEMAELLQYLDNIESNVIM